MKIGHQGEKVKDLQRKLSKIFDIQLKIDGDFGKVTLKYVKAFQGIYDLEIDGIVGKETWGKINTIYYQLTDKKPQFKPKFVVFVDAGHGGLNNGGHYVTPGKRWHHPGLKLHDNGWYYEGYENRIVAEMAIQALAEVGIMAIRTYHPVIDTPLRDRAELVRAWLNRGYYGWMHSFHSNAISETNSIGKLNNTTGFMVFTTKKDNLSDTVADLYYHNVAEITPYWKHRKDLSDLDNDFEANFQILRETDLTQYGRFAATLGEWGFHSSVKDVQHIIRTRDERVKAFVKTALQVKELMSK